MYKICVVTGSRAEYGIMKPLLKKIKTDGDIQLSIVATAMHMEAAYGLTYRFIEEDGFTIAQKIPIGLRNTSKNTIVRSISKLQLALSQHLEIYSYDLIVILGDRYEMIAVSNVALIYNVPVCHLHGGEKTLGSFDEYIRHAITKMSHLHLVATEEYRNRVIQLGESPDRVICTGSLGADNALRLASLSRDDLFDRLDLCLPKDYYVVLFHPMTLEDDGDPTNQINTLLDALEEAKLPVIFVGSNSDTGSDSIMNAIRIFVDDHVGSYLFFSLTTQEFHSLVLHSKGLVGNSSSGLIEIPSLKRPTLNVGNRQKGRLSGPSVIHAVIDKEEILKGLSALSGINNFTNPYWKDGAVETAYLAIKTALKNGISIQKDFYDICEVSRGK